MLEGMRTRNAPGIAGLPRITGQPEGGYALDALAAGQPVATPSSRDADLSVAWRAGANAGGSTVATAHDRLLPPTPDDDETAPQTVVQAGALWFEEPQVRPRVARGRWVEDQADDRATQANILLTGRHPVPRPAQRRLPPPQRFNPAARWQTYLALAALLVAVGFFCFGAIRISQLSVQFFAPTPHAVPAPTHTPTSSSATPGGK